MKNSEALGEKEGKEEPGNRAERLAWRDLWQGTAFIICAALFVLNISISFQELLSNPTYSSLWVTDMDDIPAPAITVCPHRPWSVPGLVRAGLDTSCVGLSDCVFGTLYTLKGYLQPSQPFVWRDIEMSAEEMISEVGWAGKKVAGARWTRVGLAAIPCYTWNPSRSFRQADVDVVHVVFNSGDVVKRCPNMGIKTCEETMMSCGVDCGTRLLQLYRQNGDQRFFFMVHAADEEPVPGMLLPALEIVNSQVLTVKLLYDDSVIKDTPKRPCQPPLIYSHCLRLCYIQEVIYLTNCSLKAGGENISCPSMAAWDALWDEEEKALRGEREWWLSCGHCGISCRRRVYFVNKQTKVFGGPSFRMQMATMLHKRVVESKAYTALNFLADVGGGMGLWLGSCGFSITMMLVSFLLNITKNWRRFKLLYRQSFRSTRILESQHESILHQPGSGMENCKTLSSPLQSSPLSLYGEKPAQPSARITLENTTLFRIINTFNELQENIQEPNNEAGESNCVTPCSGTKHSRLQFWLTLALYIAFGIAFVIHATFTISSYRSYPTSTKISLTREAVLDPGVAVCSEMPFSLYRMVQYGFNNTGLACQVDLDRKRDFTVMVCALEKMMLPFMRELNGFPGNLSVQEVWESTTLPLPLVITQDPAVVSDGWRPILTDHNTCYKYTNNALSNKQDILKFDITNQFINMNCSYLYPETVCKWLEYHGPLNQANVQVTAWGDTPILFSPDNNLWQVTPEKKCYQRNRCLRELVVSYIIRRLLDTPAAPCKSSPSYSQRDCVEKCLITQLARHHSCAPPYLPVEDLPRCTAGDLRSGSMRMAREEMAAASGECKASCPRECEQTFLSVRPLYTEFGEQGEVVVRRDGAPYTVTQEKLVWPLDRAICEVGGAMGLYLGYSFLSLFQAATAIVALCASVAHRAVKRLRGRSRQPHPSFTAQSISVPATYTPPEASEPPPPPAVVWHRCSLHDHDATPDNDDIFNVALPVEGGKISTTWMFSTTHNPASTHHPTSNIAHTHPQNLDHPLSPPYHSNTRLSSVVRVRAIPPSATMPGTHATVSDTNRGRRSRRVVGLAAMLPCTVIFCSMALLQWREYASFPVFTSYKTHYLKEVIFPGVTFCVWPPFNPRRLADMGVDYNFSHHCQRVDDDIKYKLKCDWVKVFEDLLKKLPGAWSQDLDHIWQDAAWRPHDLFTSFTLARKTYNIVEAATDHPQLPLQSTLSTLNRCFTFTTPTRLVHPHTYLYLQLTKLSRQYNVGLQRCGDPKYFWKLDKMFLPKSVHDFWKCYLDYFKMYVVVHPPHQAPLLLDGLTATEVMVAANNVKTRIEVSLDVYDRLRSGQTPCVEEGAGSQEVCVQRCVANVAISERGCRLPYAAWSPAPLCSREEYMDFPKYDSSVVDSLTNRSHVWTACLAACPETCRVLHYTTTDNIDSKNNIEVAFARPLYNEISESWSYSSVQLVSDVASVASLFLGVSLYQILTCCLDRRRSQGFTAH